MDPNENVMAEETGDQGQATVRLVTRIDPAVVAQQKRERQSATQNSPVRPGARARVLPGKRANHPPVPPTEPNPPPSPPASKPDPERAPAVPEIPVRLLEIRVDGERRPLPSEGAGSLLRAFLYVPTDGLAFEMRPEAKVDASDEVVLKVANDGPAAMIALLGFEGETMRASHVTLGKGVEAEIRLAGPLSGHIELAYNPT